MILEQLLVRGSPVKSIITPIVSRVNNTSTGAWVGVDNACYMQTVIQIPKGKHPFSGE